MSSAFASRGNSTRPLCRVSSRWGIAYCVLLGVAFVSVMLSSMACAQDTARFVTRSFRGREVLTVEAVLQPPSNELFGNMRVTVTCAKGVSQADRNLTAIFYVRSYDSNERHMAYYVPVNLGEGQTQVAVDIPHAAIDGQTLWDVVLIEDGRDIEDDRKRAPNQSNFQWNGARTPSSMGTVAFLIENSSDADPRVELAKLYPDALDLPMITPRYGPVVTAMLAGANNTNQNVVPDSNLFSIDEAATDWREYLGYRACVLTLSCVEQLYATQPEVANALREYVACGGRLLIHDAGDESRWATIKQLLSLDDQIALEDRSTVIKIPKQPWWESPDFAEDDVRLQTLRPKKGARTQQEVVIDHSLRLDGVAYDSFVAWETWNKWFWGNHLDNLTDLSDFLQSDVLYPYWYYQSRESVLTWLETEAVFEFDYLNGSVSVTKKPLESLPIPLRLYLGNQAASNSNAIPVGTGYDGNWFWRNYIKQVGKPPVWVFCGLVALFGALIGPGLLVFTGRMKRRSLMIFLVPAMSLIATLSIILYGVFHEGFDSYVRITSIQAIEPQSGKGFVWSRQNYFSGLPPRDGLNFDASTYVRPVPALDVSGNSYVDPKQGVSTRVFLGEGQNWQGWLKSRQQQQLLLGHPAEQLAMPIAMRATDSGSVVVKNLTDALLPLIVLRGQGDDYYLVESLASGASAEVESTEKQRIGSRLALAFAPFQPEPPSDLIMSRGSFGSRRGLARANSVSADLIDQKLKQYFSERHSIPRGGFAVLCTKSDAAKVPVTGNVSDSIHVVFGVQEW